MQTETASEPIIHLTPSAAEEVKSLLGKPENSGKVLRVYVEKGGCSGMQYSMVFDEKRADDLAAEVHGISVLVDPFSARGLLNVHVVDRKDLNRAFYVERRVEIRREIFYFCRSACLA